MSLTPLLHSEQPTRGYWMTTKPRRDVHKWVMWVTRHTYTYCRLSLKCDGTRAEIRFLLSAKRKSPFKSAGASVQSTTGSRGVRISGSNAGYTMFRGSVKGTGYPLHSTVSPSLPLPYVIVCHHISTGLYYVLRIIMNGLPNSRNVFTFTFPGVQGVKAKNT